MSQQLSPKSEKCFAKLKVAQLASKSTPKNTPLLGDPAPASRPPAINVEFSNTAPTPQVVDQICSMYSPDVVLWYIGTTGLKVDCVNFYRKELIAPILTKNPHASFWLVDLSAWTCFKEPALCSMKVSRFADKIDSFQLNDIKCIRSADLFESIKTLRDSALISHLRKTLIASKLLGLSKSKPEIGQPLKSVFGEEFPLLACLGDVDLGYAYSSVQYLEGLLIVKHILEQKRNAYQNNEIVFCLPNNELQYYSGGEISFLDDLTLLLRNSFAGFNTIENLWISFVSFKYGKDESMRPYAGPGKRLSGRNTLTSHLIGIPTAQPLPDLNTHE